MGTPSLGVVILAAGKGTRMKSDLPKVMHRLAGRPLIRWVLDAALALRPELVVAVLGAGRETVERELSPGVRVAVQDRQLGTGHAVLSARSHLSGLERCLVMSGDVPLIRPETLARLAAGLDRAECTVATFLPADPAGYGRIVRNERGGIGIVEDADAPEAVRSIREANAGTYGFRTAPLWRALAAVGKNNRQGEYYLTDAIGMMEASAEPVADPEEAQGVNTPADLERLEAAARQRGDGGRHEHS